MADGAWSESQCRPEVWFYGYPNQGTWYWTSAHGYVWVGDAWQPYRQQGFECGGLREPVKPWGYMSETDSAGQWFRGGRIYAKYGYWHVELGDWGQNGGTFAPPADFPKLPGRIEPTEHKVIPRRPKASPEMKKVSHG